MTAQKLTGGQKATLEDDISACETVLDIMGDIISRNKGAIDQLPDLIEDLRGYVDSLEEDVKETICGCYK